MDKNIRCAYELEDAAKTATAQAEGLVRALNRGLDRAVCDKNKMDRQIKRLEEIGSLLYNLQLEIETLI